MKERFILKRKAYEKSKEEVERIMSGVQPEVIWKYYVEINGVKYPPKQILSIVLKLGRVEFTTMDAANILRRLGFKIERI